MIIDCISDLHGHYPELEGGDLLIVAGDLTAKDLDTDWCDFEMWLLNEGCKYKERIIVAGNHDNFLQSMDEHRMWRYWGKCVPSCTYLCDSGTEFEGLKLWGSPWSKTFEGMNPHCKAFTVDTEEELAAKWALIPPDTGILITHIPAYGLRDGRNAEQRLGSHSLLRHLTKSRLHENLKLHVFGHIHQGYGSFDIRKTVMECEGCSWPVYVNASHVNERYEPVNKVMRIEL